MRNSLCAAFITTLLILSPAFARDVRFVRASASPGGNGQSWATAYSSLVDALAEAGVQPAVTEIWVAAGTYTPDRGSHNRSDAFVLVSNVSLLGGFAGDEVSADQRAPALNVTILSGDLSNNDLPNFQRRTDNCRHVLVGANLASGVIDGFTIRGGNADFRGDDLLGGGALYLFVCNYQVRNCLFTDNIAGGVQPDIGGFGGAVLIRGGTASVSSCAFEANRGMNGGALAISGFDPDRSTLEFNVTIADCDFTNNFSPSQTGGAMWTTADPPLFGPVDSGLTVTRCNFVNNRAEYFGAWIDQNTPRLAVIDCVFSGNSALEAGGAFAVSQTAGPDIAQPALLERCTFEANRNPRRGAAVFAQSRKVLMDRCIVHHNVGSPAIESGPTLGFSFPGRELEIRGCLVHDNTGTGVFGFRNFALRVVNSTIARNTNIGQSSGLIAGGIETSAAVVAVINSILWGNLNAGTATEQTQLRSFTVSSSVNFSMIQGLTGGLGGVGNSGADPLFVNTSGGDFHLSPGSPGIDAGSSAGVPADLDTDLDGAARRADDPTALDTGEGPHPIVDIGAFERAGLSPCRADFDGNGTLNSQDFFDFIGTFFELEARADFNADGFINSQDFFDFISAFLAGC
ncbi:MAG: right-handed parallel beta-helix repeat-containing protein [Pyrinomonadaceae bacterium]|nr:right-handed parallel beta-helix repeat-containing protein [Phycisphaerales bacterium]